ncbi:MAG: hypothetical protein P1S60_00185 [Anaerolineae bacterium]|nr:hypothetical protein [Anaerolineae bacterium]
MAFLCGKGIWLAHSHDLQRGAEMAAHITGTHLLVKVGHGPIYFPETTRNLLTRIRLLGFHPAAWLPLTHHQPELALKAIVSSLDMGYEFLVLHLGETTLTEAQILPLVEALDNVEVPRARLYIASPPLSHMSGIQGMKVLVPFCQGGWMPLAFGSYGGSAEVTVDRSIYQALGDLSSAWGETPTIFPVLSPTADSSGSSFLPEAFIPWVEAITRHGVDFFSIFDAARTEKALWPMLGAVKLSCSEVPATEDPVHPDRLGLPQPVFIVAKAGDTVWGFISRHGLTKTMFWEWNAHLWDDRGLPRDPDYLQEGWRIRVK